MDHAARLIREGRGNLLGPSAADALVAERDALREALVALVDVQPYLHPNRTKALKWEDKRQAALDLAASALDSHP